MSDPLDLTFAALADPTRRAILAKLALGESSVTELAEPFAMSLPAISRHIKVLEHAGLISQGRQAQRRPCRIEPGALKDVAQWMEEYRKFWAESLDRMQIYVEQLHAERSAARDEEKDRQGEEQKKEAVMLQAGNQSSAPGMLFQDKGEAEMAQETLSNTAEREITDIRVINAPRELIWKVWTEPVHVTQWWGPNGFTNTTEKMDVRPGGEWTHVMHGPDGRNYPNRIVYREVVEPERLVFDHISTPNHRTTVTFEDLGGGKTKLTFVMIFDTAEDKRWTAETFKAVEGLNQTLGRMEDYLAKRSGARGLW